MPNQNGNHKALALKGLGSSAQNVKQVDRPEEGRGSSLWLGGRVCAPVHIYRIPLPNISHQNFAGCVSNPLITRLDYVKKNH